VTSSNDALHGRSQMGTGTFWDILVTILSQKVPVPIWDSAKRPCSGRQAFDRRRDGVILALTDVPACSVGCRLLRVGDGHRVGHHGKHRQVVACVAKDHHVIDRDTSASQSARTPDPLLYPRGMMLEKPVHAKSKSSLSTSSLRRSMSAWVSPSSPLRKTLDLTTGKSGTPSTSLQVLAYEGNGCERSSRVPATSSGVPPSKTRRPAPGVASTILLTPRERHRACAPRE